MKRPTCAMISVMTQKIIKFNNKFVVIILRKELQARGIVVGDVVSIKSKRPKRAGQMAEIVLEYVPKN